MNNFNFTIFESVYVAWYHGQYTKTWKHYVQVAQKHGSHEMFENEDYAIKHKRRSLESNWIKQYSLK